MKQVRDTSLDYDDLVGYKAKETIKVDLADFIGVESEKKSEVPTRKIDPDFPEDWQNLYVNISNQEMFLTFMNLIGEQPSPKTKILIFSKNKNNGILGFFEDD
jgi:hypothetical protein